MNLTKDFQNWFDAKLREAHNKKEPDRQISIDCLMDSKSYLFDSFAASATIYEQRCCVNCCYYSGIRVKHCTHHVQYIDNELTFNCRHFDDTKERENEEIYY